MGYKEFVTRSIEKNSEKIVNLSNKIFDLAEIGFREYKSVEAFVELLKTEEFSIEKGIAGMPTAFKATYGHGKPIIGFLAEYDALPNLGQMGGCSIFSPTKENKDGHGCGHNLIGAGAFAAALAVKEYLKENSKEGTVILFGCPSEEKGNGKTIMAREGVFNGTDIALTWHPFDNTSVFDYGTLANVSVFFSFQGITAHAAAAPEMGRSALDAAELMSVGVNYLREHIIPEARVHYAYRDVGGIAPNVVQGHSTVHYFIRAPKSSQVKEIYKRVIDVAEGAAKMTGTKMSYDLYAGLSDFVPNHKLSEVVHESMKEIGAPEFDDKDIELAHKFFNSGTPEEIETKKLAIKVKYGEERAKEFFEKPLDMKIPPLVWGNKVLAGSTDVGDVSYVVPTAQLSYATATIGTAAHTWQMTAHGNTSIAHKGLFAASKALALAAIKVLEDETLLKEIRNEWEKTFDNQYECPIPADVPPRLND